MSEHRHLSWSSGKFHIQMSQTGQQNVKINIVEIRGNKSVLSHNRIRDWEAAKGYVDEWLRDHR